MFDITAGCFRATAASIGGRTNQPPREIKDGSKPPSARKLTLNENNAHNAWRGPKAIVTSQAEAVLVAKLLRQRHFHVVDGNTADALEP